MAREKLADADVAKRLGDLDGWTRDGDGIAREWKFPDWTHAVLFTNAVAHVAETRDHHPDVTLSYGRVRVAFTTHSAGGLTDLDFELARDVDALPMPARRTG